MDNLKITFNNKKNAGFASELKENVYAYFENKGISTYANTPMVIKTIVMLSLYFVPYCLIMTNQFNQWQMLGLCIVMGVGIVGIGCAIQHDANHSAYSEKEWINRTLGFTLNLIGGNDYMWKIKHNILHHTYTNIHGKDEDISVATLLRMSPNAPYKPIHRFQHWFAWLAYCSLTFFWVFYFDFPKLARYNGHGSPNAEIKHPAYEVFKLFASKILCYLYMLVLPMIVLDIAWWKVLVGFSIMHMVAGFLLTTTFQLAHIVEDTEHPKPSEDGNIDNAWFIHQLETTSNFATKNKSLTWFVGGLNYQVEHHLFPRICSIHYPAISKIVRETAEKHGVNYLEQPTLGDALKSHYQILKKFSVPS